MRVILKNLRNSDEQVTIAEVHDEKEARRIMANFRRAKWTVNRRPDVDTIDHIALTFTRE